MTGPRGHAEVGEAAGTTRAYRFLGFALVKDSDGRRYRLPMTGTVAQWLTEGATYRLTPPAR